MSTRMNIVELADQLIANAQTAKTASAASGVETAAVAVSHPVALLLKSAAAALRATPDSVTDTSLEAVEKLAMSLSGGGAGGQAPSMGAIKGSTPPALPGLHTSNMGVTAGTGGAAPVNKIATELRKIAAIVRAQPLEAAAVDAEKIAHTLNAACGLQHLAEGLR